jgi:hypothetical protein
MALIDIGRVPYAVAFVADAGQQAACQARRVVAAGIYRACRQELPGRVAVCRAGFARLPMFHPGDTEAQATATG